MFAASRPGAGPARWPAGLTWIVLLTVAAFASPLHAATPPPVDSASFDPPAAPLLRPPGPASAAVDTATRRRAREMYGRGILLEQQGAYSAAIVSYTKAGQTDPTLRGPSFRIGQLYASRRQWDPAARAFREELRRNPDDRPAAREYALMLVELGDTTRPLQMLENLTRRAPGDATVWRALGFVHERRGNHRAAEKALRGAIALNEKYVLAWRDLGVVLAAQDRTREARVAYQRVLALAPEDVSAIVNLANLESAAGAHARALELYRSAEKLDSLQGYAYQGQVRELVALGREADAGDVWRRWVEVTPQDLEVRESAARHFLRQRRPDIAVALGREGVRLAPSASAAWWLLGEMHAQMGDTLSAVSTLHEAGQHARDAQDRERAQASLAALRAAASPPLRARFPADSLGPAPADTARVRGR